MFHKSSREKAKWIALGFTFIIVLVLVVYPVLASFHLPAILGAVLIFFFISIFVTVFTRITFGIKERHKLTKITLVSFLIPFGFNIFIPPLIVTPAGDILNAQLTDYASDVAVAQLWLLIAPKPYVYTLTYAVTPAILIFLLPALVLSNNMMKRVVKDIGS